MELFGGGAPLDSQPLVSLPEDQISFDVFFSKQSVSILADLAIYPPKKRGVHRSMWLTLLHRFSQCPPVCGSLLDAKTMVSQEPRTQVSMTSLMPGYLNPKILRFCTCLGSIGDHSPKSSRRSIFWGDSYGRRPMMRKLPEVKCAEFWVTFLEILLELDDAVHYGGFLK